MNVEVQNPAITDCPLQDVIGSLTQSTLQEDLNRIKVDRMQSWIQLRAVTRSLQAALTQLRQQRRASIFNGGSYAATQLY